jgi:Fe-S cluster biosynthesis and repair protein YggX
MIETKKVPKSLFDLAKALSRWASEGGATELQGLEVGQEIAPEAAEERILRCLGAAVILQWNDLPTDIQRVLFEDAASMSDPERRFRLKQQMARFLHNHKDDAE